MSLLTNTACVLLKLMLCMRVYTHWYQLFLVLLLLSIWCVLLTSLVQILLRMVARVRVMIRFVSKYPFSLLIQPWVLLAQFAICLLLATSKSSMRRIIIFQSSRLRRAHILSIRMCGDALLKQVIWKTHGMLQLRMYILTLTILHSHQ